MGPTGNQYGRQNWKWNNDRGEQNINGKSGFFDYSENRKIEETIFRVLRQKSKPSCVWQFISEKPVV